MIPVYKIRGKIKESTDEVYIFFFLRAESMSLQGIKYTAVPSVVVMPSLCDRYLKIK